LNTDFLPFLRLFDIENSGVLTPDPSRSLSDIRWVLNLGRIGGELFDCCESGGATEASLAGDMMEEDKEQEIEIRSYRDDHGARPPMMPPCL
jgi:hypothetical protein